MSLEKLYQANKEIWNSRVNDHVNSEFYDNTSFLKGRSSLNSIELKLLGEVRNKKILHLQCHFGQDSLSLSRMGAKVTGVDISDKAIEKARELNDELGLDAQFVCCNVLDIEKHINETFDIIFASYGTIGWLQNLDPYFKGVSNLLNPGGQYIIVDFHPVYWMHDEDISKIQYSYFNRGVIEEEIQGSYASESSIKKKEYGWNHSFGEIFSSIHKTGLSLVDFQEYDFSPYDIFKNGVKTKNGYQINGFEGMLPLVYSIVVKK